MVLSQPMVPYVFSLVVQHSRVAFVLFYSVKYCGAHLHQMVALEGAMARASYCTCHLDIESPGTSFLSSSALLRAFFSSCVSMFTLFSPLQHLPLHGLC